MGNSLSSANVSVEEVQRKLKISLLARHKLFLEDADQKPHRSLRDLLDSHRPKAISEDGALSKNEILSWAKELSLLNLNESALENLFQITNTTSPTFDELCALLGLAKGSDRKIPLKLKMWLRARRTRNGKKKCKAIDDLHSRLEMGDARAIEWAREASRCAGHVQDLFRILRANCNFDDSFLETKFGICYREQTVEDMVASEKYKGGLPMLLPVDELKLIMPDWFIEDGPHIVFSPAWPTAIKKFVVDKRKEDDRIEDGAAWMAELKSHVEKSVVNYATAWSMAQTDPASTETLLSYPDYKEYDDLIQPEPEREEGESMLEACMRRAESEQENMKRWMCKTWNLRDEDFIKVNESGKAPKWKVILDEDTFLVVPGVKSRERVETKASNKYEEKYGEDGKYLRVRDYVRFSVVGTSLAALVKQYGVISKSASLVEMENRFRVPTMMGWRDIQLLMVQGKDKYVVEIQMQLQAMNEMRQQEHESYKKVREMLRDEILADNILDFLTETKSSAMQQPVLPGRGVIKVYFRQWNCALTIGDKDNFYDPYMSNEELKGMLALNAPQGTKRHCRTLSTA